MSLKTLHKPQHYGAGVERRRSPRDNPGVAFSPVEQEFFETAQARTDADDEATSEWGPELGARRTGTIQLRATRCYAVFR